MPVYEASLVRANGGGEETDNKTTKNAQELSDMVVKAAENSRRVNKVSSNLTLLNINDMKLHGREEDMKLLRSKLLELKNGREGDDATKSMPELVLISGISGTGKSSLVMKGVRDPAEKMGMKFVGGKFDLKNTSMPLSAFADAMASLTSLVTEGDMKMKKMIQDGINESFDDKDMTLIVKAVSVFVFIFPKYKFHTDAPTLNIHNHSCPVVKSCSTNTKMWLVNMIRRLWQ